VAEPRAPLSMTPGAAPQPEQKRSLVSWLVETRSIMPAAGATGVPLILAIAAMCFLASLALGAALSVGQTAANWRAELSGALTVEIIPSEQMTPEAQSKAVLGQLRATPGIISARALTLSETQALLEPWLGKGNVTEDLPLPVIIDVKLDQTMPMPDLTALGTRVKAAAPGAELDTHRLWQGELLRAARSAQYLAYGILLVIGATTIAIVIFATRAGLSANREVVEVLHLIGARDRFIASEVQRHFLYLGLRGGLIGLALSAATFLALNYLGAGNSMFLIPVQGLKPEFYPALIGVPLAASFVSVVTARQTVLRTLARLL
jgi:cell division transport system permease protein